MANINFPSNPAAQTPANTFSPTSTPNATSNGTTYTYDGTKWVGSSSGGGGGGSQDLQSVTDEGNTTTNGAEFGGGNISLKADGKASIASNTSIGSLSLSSETASGFLFVPQGLQYAQRPASSPNEPLYQGYKGTTRTIALNCDGSASFVGTVGIGATNPGTSRAYIQADDTNTAGLTINGRPSSAGVSSYSSLKITGSTPNAVSTHYGVEFIKAPSNTESITGYYADITGTYNTQTNFHAKLTKNLAAGTAGYCYYADLATTNSGGRAYFAYFYNSTIGSLFSIDSSGDLNSSGSATFAGTVTSANSFAIQLEADDDAKYTSTTDADGVETRVYNGAVLDVKERIQNVLARMDAIEANEVTDDATDNALLTLVANLSSRLDERDAQIAALTARLDAAGL